MKRTFVILVAILLTGAFILGGCSKTTTTATTTAPATTTQTATSTVKPITLVFQLTDPQDSIWGKVFDDWANQLEQFSGGRVNVEMHYNLELVGLPDVYNAVMNDTLDIANHLTSMPSGSFPLQEISAFTSLNVTTADYSRVQWELYKEFPEIQAEYKDVKVIWIGNTWPNPLGTSAKFGPVTKLSDNQGMKEVVFGDWQGQLGASLGRVGVSLQPADTYSAFEKGVADGMQASISLFRTAKFGEVLPNITLMAGPLGAWDVIMNQAKFDSLPADIQQWIDNSSENLVDAFDTACLDEYKADLAAFPSEFDTKFYTIPADQLPLWNAARQPVFDKFTQSLDAQGLPGDKLMSEWQRLEKQYTIK